MAVLKISGFVLRRAVLVKAVFLRNGKEVRKSGKEATKITQLVGKCVDMHNDSRVTDLNLYRKDFKVVC